MLKINRKMKSSQVSQRPSEKDAGGLQHPFFLPAGERPSLRKRYGLCAFGLHFCQSVDLDEENSNLISIFSESLIFNRFRGNNGSN